MTFFFHQAGLQRSAFEGKQSTSHSPKDFLTTSGTTSLADTPRVDASMVSTFDAILS